MHTATRFRTLISLSALLIVGMQLTACGGGTVSPTSSVASATPASAPAPGVTPVQLTGTPATTVTAGQTYSFQPSVSQGAGVVTFSIQGQPNWANFNAKTGALSGTPAPVNEGSTGLITITGSNGSTSSSIGPFTIAVKAPVLPTGSATLTWTEPTENTDGTPITGLAGYHIYYGTSQAALSTTITVASPTETTFVVSGLAARHLLFYRGCIQHGGHRQPSIEHGQQDDLRDSVERPEHLLS